MKDEDKNKVYGCTCFSENETPIIYIDSCLSIQDAVEVFAHELSHVSVGIDAEHGKEWEKAFDDIYNEYNRSIEKLCETAKQIFLEPNIPLY